MNGPTHTVGSHSDDRGGESDWPCYCDQNVAPSNSKSEDNLYEMLDAFALEYLEAHMEPDYSISQRLQVESELVQDVKEQVKAWHKAEQAKLLAEIERLKNEP